jgi:hypothetical protein
MRIPGDSVSGLSKFLIGMVLTILLTVGAHSGLGTGTAFIDTLEQRAQVAIGEAGGTDISIRFVREPSLARAAYLSGTADAAMRRRVLDAVRAVPGISSAQWTGGE